MKIESIGFIGGTNGLGNFLAQFFAKKFPQIKIMTSGRKTKITNADIVKSCDVVFFAVPIGVTEQTILSLIPLSRKNQIWSDITSIKASPIKTMLKSKAQVCGTHPIFGPMDNIDNQPIVYCPERITKTALKSFLSLFSECKLFPMSPEDHDTLMSIIQCVSHFSDMVMGEALRRSKISFQKIWDVSSPSYRLKLEIIGRMFHQNPLLYSEIATMNPQGKASIKLFLESLEHMKTFIEEGKKEDMIKKFDQIKKYLGSDFCAQAYKHSESLFSIYSSDKAIPHSKERKVPTSPQKKSNVAIFGDFCSHTDQAAKEHFKNDYHPTYYHHIFQIFQAIDENKIPYGFLPYENFRGGSIFQTLENLFQYENIKILGLYEKEIHQHLITLPETKKEDIKSIHSHSQALYQCGEFLHKNFPEAIPLSENSTAAAAHLMIEKQDKSMAIIGSKQLAEYLNLQILYHQIQNSDNQTKFITIGKSTPQEDKPHTSMVFWFSKDKAESLSRVLNIFAENHINLVKIDSWRTKNVQGEYLFFIDAEISLKDFKPLYIKIKELVLNIRILGTY